MGWTIAALLALALAALATEGKRVVAERQVTALDAQRTEHLAQQKALQESHAAQLQTVRSEASRREERLQESHAAQLQTVRNEERQAEATSDVQLVRRHFRGLLHGDYYQNWLENWPHDKEFSDELAAVLDECQRNLRSPEPVFDPHLRAAVTTVRTRLDAYWGELRTSLHRRDEVTPGTFLNLRVDGDPALPDYYKHIEDVGARREAFLEALRVVDARLHELATFAGLPAHEPDLSYRYELDAPLPE